HLGSSALQYAKVSVVSRSDGIGGEMYVPRGMYSLSTSFWIVPVNRSPATPCSCATNWYITNSTAAGALIVIDVETTSNGKPCNRILMSSIESIATPTLPTSPAAMGSSES